VLLDRGTPVEATAALEADDLLVTNGCGPALEHLLFAITDPGDAVLTPAPIYAGFLMDAGRRAESHLSTFPVPVDATPRLDRATLETAAAAAHATGHPPRVLLLASPYNPLGVCWSLDELATAVHWCADTGAHLISDEIYAASVFSSPVRFSSAFALASLEPEWATDRLHLLYGFSKDLGLSGLRAGVIGTRSAALHRVLDGLTYFCGCSNATQELLLAILGDPIRRDGLLARNRSNLARLASSVTTALKAADVPHTAAQAGFFTWVDLRSWLPEATPEGETALWRALLDEARVLLTPGLACRAAEPGFFRLCFAAVPEDGLAVGLQRLTGYLSCT
jgi:1-aminocyclopropane-1-carboxylate synthase